MVSLRIDGQFADLAEGAKIQISRHFAFWELEKIKGAKTMNIVLAPSGRNAQLFGFPNVPSNAVNPFKEFLAEIYRNGESQYQGKFKLTAASAEKFEGFFKFDAAELSQEFADLSIREMLKDLVFSLGGNTSATLENWTDADADVCFPTMRFGEVTVNQHPYSFTPYPVYYSLIPVVDFEIPILPTALRSPVLPCFSFKYIFEQLMAVVGYSLPAGWGTENPTVATFKIWNNRPLPVSLNFITQPKPKHHIPELKFREFLAEMRLLFGLDFEFDSKFKSCTVRRINQIVAESGNVTDITSQAGPVKLSEFKLSDKGGFEGLSFGFTRDKSDARTSAMPETLEELVITSPAEFQIDLGVPSSAQIGNTALVMSQVRYFKVAPWADGGQVHFPLADAIFDRKTSDSRDILRSKFSPVASVRWLRLSENTGNIREFSDGKAEIVFEKLKRFGTAYIVFTKSTQYPTGVAIKISEYRPAIGVPDSAVLYLDYTTDEAEVEFEMLFSIDHEILQTDSPMADPTQEKMQEFAPRFFQFHGLVQKNTNPLGIGEPPFYPFGSSSNYRFAFGEGLASGNEPLSAVACTWEGDSSLYNYNYKSLDTLLKGAISAECTAHLTYAQMFGFKRGDKVRIDDAVYYLEELTADISQDAAYYETKLKLLKQGAYAEPCEKTITIIIESGDERIFTFVTSNL